MSPADSLNIEAISAENAADAAALHAKCFAHGWPVADFRRYAEDKGYCGLLAYPDGGAAAGLVIAGLAGDEAEILTIATDPALRRKGVAKRLLSAILENLSDTGIAAIFLEVGVTNRVAIGLYESFGFAPVGKRPAYYHHANGSEDALILRRLPR